jgi:hypothetical protein
MERLRATPGSYARKIKFIEVGMRESAHEENPSMKKTVKKNWSRIIDIGLLYNMGPETTLESVGALFGISREAVRQANVKFFKYFHGNCSLETQGKYPLWTIPFDKPRLKVPRNRQSIVHEDMTPAATEQSYEALKARIDDAADKDKLRELLYEPSDGSIRGLVERYKGDRAIYIYLGSILKDLGLGWKNAKSFADRLGPDYHVPNRPIKDEGKTEIKGKKYSQNHYVVLAKHKDEVIKAVKDMMGISESRRRDLKQIYRILDEATNSLS